MSRISLITLCILSCKIRIRDRFSVVVQGADLPFSDWIVGKVGINNSLWHRHKCARPTFSVPLKTYKGRLLVQTCFECLKNRIFPGGPLQIVLECRDGAMHKAPPMTIVVWSWSNGRWVCGAVRGGGIDLGRSRTSLSKVGHGGQEVKQTT